MIEEIDINSWQQLSEQFARVSTTSTHWIFRGQANFSWELAPSLLRELSPLLTSQALIFEPGIQRKQVWDREADLIRKFRSRCQQYLSAESLMMHLKTDRPTDWLPLMQHHGVPTRLLDWSKSLFVATYFAAIDDFNSDGVVWCVNRNWLGTDGFFNGAPPCPFGAETGELWKFATSGSPTIKTFKPLFPSARMIAQQGLFGICGDPLQKHCAVIEKHFASPRHIPIQDSELTFKLKILAAAKRPLLQALRHMNITAETLFPGLDGWARSLRDSLRIQDVAEPNDCI